LNIQSGRDFYHFFSSLENIIGFRGLKIKGKGLEFKIDPIHHKTKLFQFKIFRRAGSIKELFLGED